MSRGKNPIWEYFRKVDNEPSKAECIECDKVLSLGSDKPRHQTVSALKGHLSTCHKAIYTAYVKRVAEDDGEQAKKKMKVESAATSSKSVTSWTQSTPHALSVSVSDFGRKRVVSFGVISVSAESRIPLSV